MFAPTTTTEIDRGSFQVINLINAFEDSWSGSGTYPGEPYEHNRFRTLYSDHHPVCFRMESGESDDA